MFNPTTIKKIYFIIQLCGIKIDRTTKSQLPISPNHCSTGPDKIIFFPHGTYSPSAEYMPIPSVLP